MAAQSELGVGEQLLGGHAELVEPPDLRLRERLVGDVRQRRPAPDSERLLQHRRRPVRTAPGELAPALREQLLEPARIEPLGIESQLVAAVAGQHDPLGTVALAAGQCLAQVRDVDLQCLPGGRRGSLAPQLVDHAVSGERLVGVQQQQGEQCALLAPAQRDRVAPVAGLEGAEDAEVHGGSERLTTASPTPVAGVQDAI